MMSKPSLSALFAASGWSMTSSLELGETYS
jgi:hypothetical protein